MNKSIAFAAVLTLAVAQPALADEYYAVTPSGATEGYFDISVVQTSDLLTNKCIDLGWTVVSTTATVVTCQAPMNFGQQLLSNLLIGNQYSTPPKMYYRFNLAGSGPSTRVQANGWIETQMAFGQVRQEPMVGPPFHNSVMDFFVVAGGRWPAGTSFPNHVFIGAGADLVEKPEKGLRLKDMDVGAPVSRAGLQNGDVVTRIAGKRVKDAGDLTDALAKATEAPTYTIEYYRNGQKATATVEREFRAAVVAPELPAASPEPELTQAPVPAAVSPLSVADELAKFAKLRDDGILTQDEFDAQKARLLGQ